MTSLTFRLEPLKVEPEFKEFLFECSKKFEECSSKLKILIYQTQRRFIKKANLPGGLSHSNLYPETVPKFWCKEIGKPRCCQLKLLI